MSVLEHVGEVSGRWPSIPIGSVLTLVNGRAFKPSEWSQAGRPIIRIQNLNNALAPFNRYEGDLPPKYLVSDGDLLFAWSGTPDTSFGAHIWNGGPAWLNQHIFKVLFDEAVFDSRYLRYAINQNLEAYIGAAHGGAGLAHITKGKFESFSIPQPPVKAQRELVSKLDEQLSQLDAGVAALRRAQANLKRYRASVLKAACEGRLVPTEAELARQEGREYESGAHLLRCLLADRRASWSGRGAYKEPHVAAIAELPSLPDGWTWASPAQLSSAENYSLGIGPFGSNLKVSDYKESGVPLIFVRNIRSGVFRGVPTIYVSHEKAKELKAHSASSKDILITKMGDPPGDACIYPDGLPDAIVTADCIKWRLSPVLASTAFFSGAVNSAAVKAQIAGITKGVAQLKVSLARFQTIAMPLPPLAEQERIVAEVERRLSVADALGSTIAANLMRANRLRQAILRNAFYSR